MKHTLAPFFACLGLLALLTGCNSATKVSGLTVELAKLERAADGSLTATLRYINPNVVSYNVAGSTHRLSLNGRTVGTIAADDPVGIPPQFTLTHTGKLKLNQGTTLTAGPASYRMESKLFLRLYGDVTEYAKLSSAGTTQVATR